MNYRYSIEKAFENRRALFEDAGTDCFRLFHSKADGIDGLSIDRYGEYLLVQFFNDGLFSRQGALLAAVSEAVQLLPLAVRGLLLKDRRKSGGQEEPGDKYSSISVDGERPPAEYSVMQDGIRAGVNLLSGQHTGLFLDMREIRRKLRTVYENAGSLLNLFCYTAVFSVHALKNGVGHATNIDLSKASLERARRNYEINGLEWKDEDFIHGDSFDWIKLFIRKNRNFPLVIFDPPTFSRNKKKSFSIKRDYGEKLLLISLLARDGYILSCVNSAAVSEKEYLSCHPHEWENLFIGHESSDFPAPAEPYLKAGLWRVP